MTATSPHGADSPRLDQILAWRAKKTPERVAYEAGSRTLTYRELDGLANRVAHALVAAGCRRETPVALALERTLAFPVALFGALKAGGAAFYLDPADPPARRAALLDRVAPPVALTADGCDVDRPGVVRIAVDRLFADGVMADVPPETDGGADDLAQLLPTSGSTGSPKIVMRSHAMLAGQLRFEQALIGYAAHDRHLFKHVPSFRETLMPALAGGTAVVAPPGADRDSGALARLIRGRRITVASFVPSVLKDLLAQPDFAACADLRHVSCGGEPLPPELARRFHATLRARLQNTYTMTEADTVSTWACAPDHGRPPGWLGLETNMRIHVLDDRLAPAAPGEIGEIAVEGPGLARGYFGDPGATAERFMPNPFGPPGSRLYRTGDLARRLGDGSLVHAGRADDQVKIGGQRIELAEIDAVLLALPGVVDAAAAAWRGPDGTVRLVAHLVGADPSATALRARLAEALPGRMTPSLFVAAEALPRLPNGKLDRRALPAPERSRPALAVAYAAPATPAEVHIAAVWAEVLWVADVGRDDGFFDLGGTSLLAMEATTRLNAGLPRPAAVADLLSAGTVRALAAMIDARSAGRPAGVDFSERAALRAEARRARAAGARDGRGA